MKLKFNAICCSLLFVATSVFGQVDTPCVSEIKHSLIELCAYSALQLDTILTEETGEGVWSKNSESLMTIVTTDSNTIASGSGYIEANNRVILYHTVTTDSSECVDQVVIRLKPLPQPEISGDNWACVGLTAKLEVFGIFESYSWSTSDTASQIYFDEEKVISVTVTGSNGCKGTASVSTFIPELTPATISQSGLPCVGKEVTLYTEEFNSYTWSNGSNGQSIKINTNGEFSIEAVNGYGCISRDTISVAFDVCAADTTSCGHSSGLAFQWPGNRNWFVAKPSYSWTDYGYIFNSLTGDTTKVGGSFEKRTGAYEGTTAASDDQGNILFYSDGRRVHNAATQEIIYSGLLAGNEGSVYHSSAAQGVITVRHPLDPDNYHVFTVDDAIAPIYGCNHFVLNKDGSLKDGPTRLGNYNTFEGIAATKHSNGLDVWVMVMSREGGFNAYLVTSNGVDLQQSNVAQSKAYSITGDRLRGSLAFSWDGNKMAITHPQSWPTTEAGLMLYDFNNTTGELSNKMEIAPKNVSLSGYDLVFSTDDKRIFVSTYSKLAFFDISSGVASTIRSTYTQTNVDTYISNLEIGGDGKLYCGSSLGLMRIDADINAQTPNSVVYVTDEAHRSISNMYIQPAENVQITSVIDTVCNSWSEYDLNSVWECSGKSAENHSLITDTTNGYFGAGITDREQGVFNPVGLADGVYDVEFKMGKIADTMSITVKDCEQVVCDLSANTEITVSGSIVTVAESGAESYIWLDCENGNTPIAGLNTQSVSLDPGTYAVVVSVVENCKDTSDCFILLPVSVEGINANKISIYPNPVNATLNIQNRAAGIFTYEIVSILGESILKNTSSSHTQAIDVHDLAPGTYLVKVSNLEGIVINTPITKK
jgi:hypothetical protein